MLLFRLALPPGELVAQEHLPSSSCLQQGYLKAPHGAHRTYTFQRIRLAGFALSIRLLSFSLPA